MWTAIGQFLSLIASGIKSFLGIKEEQEKRKTEEFKIRNTEEEIKKAVLIEEVKIKDVHEKLVSDFKNEKDEEKRKEYLRRIRTNVGG